MIFSLEGFEYFKNIIHPNIFANKNHYLRDRLYVLPTFHGCGLRNKNGTNKKIDYKRGYQCFFPTDERYWKRYKNINKKLRMRNLKYSRYMTRYMSNHGINAFAKTKQRLWYDWGKKYI